MAIASFLPELMASVKLPCTTTSLKGGFELVKFVLEISLVTSLCKSYHLFFAILIMSMIFISLFSSKIPIIL